MNKIIISETQIKKILNTILIEEISKVKREEFTRIQFKTEDLDNALSDTIRELEKLKSSIPDSLDVITKNKLSIISSNIYNSKKCLTQLKNKVKDYKKNLYSKKINK